MSTNTRFEKEAKCNSEMAYFFQIFYPKSKWPNSGCSLYAGVCSSINNKNKNKNLIITIVMNFIEISENLFTNVHTFHYHFIIIDNNNRHNNRQQ